MALIDNRNFLDFFLQDNLPKFGFLLTMTVTLSVQSNVRCIFAKFGSVCYKPTTVGIVTEDWNHYTIIMAC